MTNRSWVIHNTYVSRSSYDSRPGSLIMSYELSSESYKTIASCLVLSCLVLSSCVVSCHSLSSVRPSVRPLVSNVPSYSVPPSSSLLLFFSLLFSPIISLAFHIFSRHLYLFLLSQYVIFFYHPLPLPLPPPSLIYSTPFCSQLFFSYFLRFLFFSSSSSFSFFLLLFF